MPETLKFLSNGKIIKPEQAFKARTMVLDLSGDASDTAQVFNTQADFKKWAAASPLAEKLARIEERAARARKFRRKDHQAALERQQLITKRTMDDLKALARAKGLRLPSPELFVAATDDSDPLSGPIFDPAFLCEHYNAGGRVIPLQANAAYATLGALNDISSSLLLRGSISLYDGAWFTGAVRHLFTSTTVTFTLINLMIFGFNDRASSAIVF